MCRYRDTKSNSVVCQTTLQVLRTTGYLDGKQDNAYGDIQVWKLPKWDQTCEADFLGNTAVSTEK